MIYKLEHITINIYNWFIYVSKLTPEINIIPNQSLINPIFI